MRRFSFVACLMAFILLIPLASSAFQDAPPLRLEITGINSTAFPQSIITSNVYDRLGQPIAGLTEPNFTLSGDMAAFSRIVKVENVADNNLSVAVVLAIDTSSSMAGTPFQRAQEAAIAFVNQIGPADPVAIVAFDSSARLVQDFTSDKEQLTAAINGLTYGGKTTLYDGALLAVQTAPLANVSRRVVILLSDGAEYGGLSKSERGSALDTAIINGVPIYTVGLGFGFDRTYLSSSSDGSNAQFYESPAPEQLLEIYQGLATKLRSQYVVTIESDIPSDGTVYPLQLNVQNGNDTASASADFRAPIPKPVLTVPDLSGQVISERTDVPVAIVADDPLQSVEIAVDGGAITALWDQQPLPSSPYTIQIDPLLLAPGSHTLTASATDSTGDKTEASTPFEIAALAPVVEVAGLPSGEISQPVTVSAAITGQTPAQSVSFDIDGQQSSTVNAAPFEYAIDPFNVAPGDHNLNINAVNQGGGQSALNQAISIAALPPQIMVDGVPTSALEQTSTLSIATVGQAGIPISNLTATVDGQEVLNVGDAAAALTLDPLTLQPNDNAELVITATSPSGASSQRTFNFAIPAFPPQVSFTGLKDGDVLNAPVTVAVQATAIQTAIAKVVYRVDGQVVEEQNAEPYSFSLDPAVLGDGEHTFAVEAVNVAGKSASTSEVKFSVALPTPTPTGPSQADLQATSDAQTALDAQATTAAVNAQATTDAANVQATTAAANTQATADAQAVAANAQATTDAANLQATTAAANTQATADAQAVAANAQATTAAQTTLDAQVAVNTQATSDAQVVAINAQATTDAANAQATADAQVAVSANATGTAQAVGSALATADAQATSSAQATNDAAFAQATAIIADATGTAQAVSDAAATANAQASATSAAAFAQATAIIADATGTAQAVSDAAATSAANAQATTDAQVTVNAQGTPETQPTSDNNQASGGATAINPTTGAADSTATLATTAVAVVATSESAGTITPSDAASATPTVLVSESQGAATGGLPVPLPICLGLIILLVLILLFLLARRRRDDDKDKKR